jgi:hypothetical protein
MCFLGKIRFQTLNLLLIAAALFAGPGFAQPSLEFRQLPKEIRDRAIDVRRGCKELDPEMTFNDMQGITVVDLKGDGSRDIVVDNEGL